MIGRHQKTIFFRFVNIDIWVTIMRNRNFFLEFRDEPVVIILSRGEELSSTLSVAD